MSRDVNDTSETPRSVEMIQVIKVTALRGRGVTKSPFRMITQYWGLDGQLLAEDDTIDGWKIPSGVLGEPDDPERGK